MQGFANYNDLVPPSKLLNEVIDKNPPSPTSCCTEGGGGETPAVGRPSFWPRRNSLVSIMKSQRRTTTPWSRVYASPSLSVVTDSQFPTTTTSLSRSVDETLQLALEICTLKNPHSPGSMPDGDVDDDEVLSKDAHRRDLLKDDMTLLYRELSRLPKEADNESFSLPSDSDLENEDEDDDYYEVSTGNDSSCDDGSVDFSKVRADFHREQNISS